jgi:hypothetical protein
MVLFVSSSSMFCVSPLSHVQPLSCNAKPAESAYLYGRLKRGVRIHPSAFSYYV